MNQSLSKSKAGKSLTQAMPTLTGILNLNKPEGMSSRQAVTCVSKVLRQAGYGRKIKVGHCGTLDPLATGVLVICIGKATRLVTQIQEQTKVYDGTFELGRVTSTDDFTGETLSRSEVSPDDITAEAIEELLPEFTGEIEQVPPAFSAVHVNGRRAYELARQGKDVKLPARTVFIQQLKLLSLELPDFRLLVECGSGTYIRSLGRDIGARLGCGATMRRLTRTQIGPFTIDDALSPTDLTPENLPQVMQSPLTALPSIPRFVIDDAQKQWAFNGREIPIKTPPTGFDSSDPRIALVMESGQLVAVASYNEAERTAKPDMVFHEQDP